MRQNSYAGPQVSLGLGYGLSRYLDAGLSLTYENLSYRGSCHDCSARLLSPVLQLGYHLVQGVRFDPWVRIGVGLSTLRLTTPAVKFDYLGVDWIDASVGGDWYATKEVAVGPELSFSLNTYAKHPEGTQWAASERIALGLRVTFDPIGH